MFIDYEKGWDISKYIKENNLVFRSKEDEEWAEDTAKAIYCLYHQHKGFSQPGKIRKLLGQLVEEYEHRVNGRTDKPTGAAYYTVEDDCEFFRARCLGCKQVFDSRINYQTCPECGSYFLGEV